MYFCWLFLQSIQTYKHKHILTYSHISTNCNDDDDYDDDNDDYYENVDNNAYFYQQI